MGFRGNANVLKRATTYLRKMPEGGERFGVVIKTNMGLLATLASVRQKNIRKFSSK